MNRIKKYVCALAVTICCCGGTAFASAALAMTSVASAVTSAALEITPATSAPQSAVNAVEASEANPAEPQRFFPVSGYVTDALSGEPLIGVGVIDEGTTYGTVTSNAGYFSITLPEGPHVLVFACIGYKEYKVNVDIHRSYTLNVTLDESAEMLDGAVVTTSMADTGVKGTQMSAIEVPIDNIKSIPAIGGEVDVIKALQLLPGVQSGTEGSAGMYVRGGGADENLLLMDGVPLYNVSHMFGFFSVFNADALKNVTLYKGSFPARFGGHLSSVIDVRMNDGNNQEIHGSASIGDIASKFNLEGPLVKGKTTFNISGRRTYMDLLARPLIAYTNALVNQDMENSKIKYGGGYDFYDLNAKFTHRFNNNDRLSLSFYSGDDEASISLRETYTLDTPTMYEKEESRIGMGWKWGNMVTSLRWNHEISPTLYMSASTSYTRYRNLLSLGLSEKEEGVEDGIHNSTQLGVNMQYVSNVNDLGGNVDFEWRPRPLHDVKFGGAYTYHTFKPGIASMSQKMSSSLAPDLNMKEEIKVGDEPLYSSEMAMYAEDNWTVTPWFKANLGLRTSAYIVKGKTYLSAEPRLSARALVSNNLSFKASYSEMSQYIHLLCNSNLSMPSDLWVPVTKNIKPMRSRQAAAGAFYDLGAFEFSAEAYYKTMNNVLEYKDGASYLGTATGWEEKVCMGKGWSYGLELMIQKKLGKTTGWIGYTLSKAMRKFDKPGNIINDGNPFPAKYDRRHDLSATVSHVFSSRFDLSATFVYASGNCGSLAFEDYYVPGVGGTGSGAGFEHGYGISGYLPYRNNYRMPDYNRMDIGANFHKKLRHGIRTVNVSIYNVYNRLNPFIVLVDNENKMRVDEDGIYHWESYPVLKKMSIFPIIPSVSYTYKF